MCEGVKMVPTSNLLTPPLTAASSVPLSFMVRGLVDWVGSERMRLMSVFSCWTFSSTISNPFSTGFFTIWERREEGGRRREEERRRGRRARGEGEIQGRRACCVPALTTSVSMTSNPAQDPREAVGSCVHSALCVQGLAGEAHPLTLCTVATVTHSLTLYSFCLSLTPR